MDRVIAPDSVAAIDAAPPPSSGTPQHWGNGDIPTMVPATEIPAYWLEGIQEENIAILAQAGITPDRTNNAQIIAALLSMFGPPIIAPTVYATPGAISYTVPANVYQIVIRARGPGGVGGAGGSSSGGGGGGGGGYCEKTLTVVPGQVIAGTVGAPGTATTISGMTAGAGANGTAGSGSTSGLAGAAGTATGGQINFAGTVGSNAYPLSGSNVLSGAGGAAWGGVPTFGSEGAATGVGTPGQQPGSGGGGGIYSGTGGAGANGHIIIGTR